MGGSAFEPQYGLIKRQRQEPQRRLFLGKGFVDYPVRCCMDPWIGDSVEPVAELAIEIIEIAEAGAEEKILPDIAEGSFNFAFRFRPVRAASAGLETIMPGEIEKTAIIDNEPIGVLTDDRRSDSYCQGIGAAGL